MHPLRSLFVVVALAFVAGCSAAPGVAMRESAASFASESVDADDAAGFPAPPAAMGGAYAPGDELAFGGEADAPPPPAPPPVAPRSPEAKPDVPSNAQKPDAIKPLLIYTATYHLAVFETEKAIDAVQVMAKALDGYLVRRDDMSIVVRVPSESYRGALDRIGKLGDVLHREETVEDVTEQFMDLMTRLKNARAVRQRLEQLLVQAKDVKDALEVERELARLTADIEVMEGRLKRLRELVAFSTITVRFEPAPSEQIRSNVRLPFPWLNRIGLQNLLDL